MNLIKIDNDFKDKENLYAVNDEAFPDEERVSSGKLISFCLNLNCDFWGIYEEEQFVGFIVLLPDKELKICYIWFLAIDKKYRSKGLGTKTLEEINKKYNEFQLILDLEKIDENANNIEQRKKRLAFYEKNGYIRTNFGMTYFNVDYEILCNDTKFNNEDFQKFINKIKLKNFHPKIYPINVDAKD